jgi:hypothetical protein
VPDFWRSCGYRLLAQGPQRTLRATDDFLRSFLARPELAPVPDSGPAELALHDVLMAAPCASVEAARIEAVEDADARENYRIWLRFRDRLVAADSLEAAYLELFRGEGVDVPPLFVSQLTQILLRHVLGDDADPLVARAAEMLFRPQKIAVTDDGAVMAADEATVEIYAESGGFGSLGELLARNRTPLRTLDLDVLDDANAALYWERDERHDLSVSLNRGRPAIAALTRVMQAWIAHFVGVDVAIRVEREIDDAQWSWHVGLDAEASALLNALYRGETPEPEKLDRLVGLFRLDFAEPREMRADVAGKPVYLGLAISAEHTLKLKPQNLLVNLPLAAPA